VSKESLSKTEDKNVVFNHRYSFTRVFFQFERRTARKETLIIFDGLVRLSGKGIFISPASD
jgi:hypothetical protein